MNIFQVIGVEVGKVLVSLIIGFVSGWVARGLKERYNNTVDNEKFIALLVAITWVTSVLVSIVNTQYQTPLALHGLMGAIVGFYYKQKKQ